MRKIRIIILLAVLPFMSMAQDIEVKKFEPMEKDQTASLSPRKDINGVMCGLVKVQLKEPGAVFEGNVMGDVQFTGKEYLVYLPNGTKRLGIKHPDYLPTTIVFADYGTKRISSASTYELRLKTNKKQAKVDNSKKGMAVFNIKPSNAMLLIDGQVADGSGGAYTLSLPYGTHYYTVKLSDFALTNQPVKIDKTAKNINVDLTDFFARVDVSCKTEDAELLINNEQKGEGRWGGMMIPGKYTVEAQKDGCHSQTRLIELKDNDTVRVDFSALKTITGGLRVDYEPAGADVLLNGKKVGVTPLVLKEIPIGKYHLEIWKEYYVKKFANIKIAEDQVWQEKGELKITQFGELVQDLKEISNDNGLYTARRLADYYRVGAANGYRGDHAACDKDTFNIPLNPVKAIEIFKTFYKEGINDNDLKELLEDLGPCYPEEKDDAKLAFCWAKHRLEEMGDEEKYYQQTAGWWNYRPYPALAWHYFYGIGCKKNIEEAKKFMRWSCTENGEYWYPAYKQMIKDMGLDGELKFNPKLHYGED